MHPGDGSSLPGHVQVSHKGQTFCQNGAGMHVVLKIVTSLPWENIQNAIICVGASRSYPFPFFSLCAPGDLEHLHWTNQITAICCIIV